MKDWKKILAIVLLSGFVHQAVLTLTPLSAQRVAARDPLTSPSSALESIVRRGTLRCAYIPYPPYFEIEPNTGRPHGLMVDVMTAIADKTGLRVAWSEEVGWGSMLEGLKAGRYDAVCSGVWQNAARAMHADFSAPIGYATVETWVRADESTIASLADINKGTVRIVTIDGEMNAMIAAERFPAARRVSLPQSTPFSDAFLTLATQKADVVFAERAAAARFLRGNPGVLKSLGEDGVVSSFPVTIVLPQNETALKTAINAAIGDLLNTRRMETIRARYEDGQSLFHLPARPYDEGVTG